MHETTKCVFIKSIYFISDCHACLVCFQLATESWNILKVRKMAKIRNQYNPAPHLTKDTNGKVTTSPIDITNESQEVSLFPAGDHKTSINRRARKHNKTRQKYHKWSTKEAPEDFKCVFVIYCVLELKKISFSAWLVRASDLTFFTTGLQTVKYPTFHC